MRAVIQRVSRAEVRVDGEVKGSIDRGFLVLLGVAHADDDAHVTWMADKVLGLRVFPDHDGKMNLALADIAGGILVVSQFTLYGDATKGRRPGFAEAARPEHAVPIYESFVSRLKESGLRVETGVFGAMMDVELVNDGPVTLLLEK
jgi:D-tyrosyl-tRNA(Tyr) deacylase